MGVHIPYANEEDCISPDSHACKLVLGLPVDLPGISKGRFGTLHYGQNIANLFQERSIVLRLFFGLFHLLLNFEMSYLEKEDENVLL